MVLRSDLSITECEAALRRATTGLVAGYLLAMLGAEDFRFGGRIRGGRLHIAWLTRWSRAFRAILAADVEPDGEGTVLRGRFTWNKPAGIALALLVLAFVLLPVVQGVAALPVRVVPATVSAVSVHLRGRTSCGSWQPWPMSPASGPPAPIGPPVGAQREPTPDDADVGDPRPGRRARPTASGGGRPARSEDERQGELPGAQHGCWGAVEAQEQVGGPGDLSRGQVGIELGQVPVRR